MFNITSDAPILIYTSLGVFRNQKSHSEYCLKTFDQLELIYTPIDLAILPKEDKDYIRSRYFHNNISTNLPILIAAGGIYDYDQIFALVEEGKLEAVFKETCEWNFVDFVGEEVEVANEVANDVVIKQLA